LNIIRRRNFVGSWKKIKSIKMNFPNQIVSS